MKIRPRRRPLPRDALRARVPLPPTRRGLQGGPREVLARTHAEEGLLTGRQEAEEGQQSSRHGPAPACNAALAPPPLYQGCVCTQRACAAPPPPPPAPLPCLAPRPRPPLPRMLCAQRRLTGREMAAGWWELGMCTQGREGGGGTDCSHRARKPPSPSPLNTQPK